MLISVVIRTLNEEKYLDELLTATRRQIVDAQDLIEVVVVDSGSSDRTLEIAQSHSARTTYISREDFTFGRSLNVGCEFARGDILVFISGHCVPASDRWLANLTSPLREGICSYSYGRQLARGTTKFSEEQIFKKYYPEYSKIPQIGGFVNNANAALLRSVWEKFSFNEELTGLEDMHLGERLVADGQSIAYCADASVFHIHDESWSQVKNRYEREAYALTHIFPEMSFGFVDLLKYFCLSLYEDWKAAISQQKFFNEFAGILAFRSMYYIGTLNGNRMKKQLSEETKRRYFYPKDVEQKDYQNGKNDKVIPDDL